MNVSKRGVQHEADDDLDGASWRPGALGTRGAATVAALIIGRNCFLLERTFFG